MIRKLYDFIILIFLLNRMTSFTWSFLKECSLNHNLWFCFWFYSFSIMYWSWAKKRKDLESVGKYMTSSMSWTIYAPVSFWQSYHSLNASWNQPKRRNGWVQLHFWQGCSVREILTLQDIIHNCGKPFLEGDTCFSNLWLVKEQDFFPVSL